MIRKDKVNLVFCVSGVLLLLILHSSEAKSELVQKKAEKRNEDIASPAKTAPEKTNEMSVSMIMYADGDDESDDSRAVPNADTPQAIDPLPPTGPSEPAAMKIRPGKETRQPSSSSAAETIPWGDPIQKEICEGYLVSMRDLFLKTRHHAIQGAPCDSAENAAAFLRISEQSAGDCPPGFNHQSGYSDRILRNIRYLESLGNDRCGVEPPGRSPQTNLMQQAIAQDVRTGMVAVTH